MNQATLDRANQITHRLSAIEEARVRWVHDGYLDTLTKIMGVAITREQRQAGDYPKPVLSFKRACLDALATEEAVLKAELEQL